MEASQTTTPDEPAQKRDPIEYVVFTGPAHKKGPWQQSEVTITAATKKAALEAAAEAVVSRLDAEDDTPAIAVVAASAWSPKVPSVETDVRVTLS